MAKPRVLENRGGMARIPGGSFRMGSDAHYPEESPARTMAVDAFWMDRHAVTNRVFADFVDATGYITVPERPVDPALFPGADPALLVPSSVVFRKTAHPVNLRDRFNWWFYVPGADWRHPRGPGSSLEGLWHHPVVQVTFEDASAYAGWAGKELPTEAEWEFAARGGLDSAIFSWGDEYMPGGRPMANTWQGEFPWQNLLEDGHEWTAPVGSFPPNGYGLYEMTGNVWEWTADWYSQGASASRPCCTAKSQQGARQKVMKGGSYLCAPNYCLRYRPAARMAQDVDSATCHLGFRCIVREKI